MAGYICLKSIAIQDEFPSNIRPADAGISELTQRKAAALASAQEDEKNSSV